MLAVHDLSVTYAGAVQALRGVSLEVPERSILAVLGSNGAGKSTLLRAISGTLAAPARRGDGRHDRAGRRARCSAAIRRRSPARASCRCPRAGASSPT